MAAIISNPPYNLKLKSGSHSWDISEELLNTNANYAFVQVGLSLANDIACYLLPTGVLTTGTKAEIEAKQKLVDDGNIRAIVAMPSKMFESTSIAICLIVFQKAATDEITDKILMINLAPEAKEEIREQRGQYGGAAHTQRVYKKTVNVLTDETIQGVVEAIKEFKPYKDLSRLVPIEEIKEQGYNLSPSRYLKITEAETKARDIEDIVRDINIFRRHQNKLKLVINGTLAKSLGMEDLIKLHEESKENEKDLTKTIKMVSRIDLIKEDYLQVTKNKNQFEFKNNDPEMFSEILRSVFNTWKANIMFLNNISNQYLAELRDALLPKLMSGEMDVEELERRLE